MARSVDIIQQQIQTELVANMAAIGIVIDTTKWSKRNLLRLLCFIFAVCTNYVEQLMDALKSEVETIASKSVAATSAWIQSQMFLFQYSATTPQVLQISDNLIQYPTVDATLRIITACSVKSNTPNVVTVKVAKGSPFVALTTNELAAAQNYINLKGTEGIVYRIISGNSDKLYIAASIYYDGQYSATIQASVISAINSFLQNLFVNNFDSSLKVTDIESAIRGVTGVNDVVLNNVSVRDDATPFANGILLVSDSKTTQRLWVPIAGYVAEETTSGKTFTDSLIFIAE